MSCILSFHVSLKGINNVQCDELMPLKKVGDNLLHDNISVEILAAVTSRLDSGWFEFVRYSQLVR